jgi:hypothetical protein
MLNVNDVLKEISVIFHVEIDNHLTQGKHIYQKGTKEYEANRKINEFIIKIIENLRETLIKNIKKLETESKNND